MHKIYLNNAIGNYNPLIFTIYPASSERSIYIKQPKKKNQTQETSFKSTPKSPKAPQDVAANRQKSGEKF